MRYGRVHARLIIETATSSPMPEPSMDVTPVMLKMIRLELAQTMPDHPSTQLYSVFRKSGPAMCH